MMATSRIFIKGLPPSITEAELRKHFSAGGREITDIKLIPQRRIGYVGYKTAEDASKAVKYFNKSYVRMSKIAVESAKPISDPSLNKNQGHARSVGPSAPGKRKSPEDATDPSDSVSNKKTKNDDSQRLPDGKLREYLQVMGTTKEAVFADPAAADPNEAEPVPKLDVPEGESDGEYEQIPSRREKPKRAEPGVNDSTSHAPAPSRDHDTQPPQLNTETESPPEKPEDSQAQSQTAPATAPPATDDDWLRSRTNRLLDLVDPDELPQPKAETEPSPPTQEPDSAAADPRVSAEESVSTPHVDKHAMDVDQQEQGDSTVDTIRRTSRLFVRNLPYGATEDDVRSFFDEFGVMEEVHLPVDKAGTPKGFALVQFADGSEAVEAFQSKDGSTFQGRIIHIIPGSAKRETGLDEFEISKLPLKKQNLIRKRAEAASSTFNWNSLYMNQDAVNTSVANRLGVCKSELLDPTSADAAVKQAIAETTVIQETKAYFANNGVDLNAFKSHKRRDETILVKNFPYGTTIDELRTLFEESGPVLRVLMPPSGTIAVVQFAQATHAKAAFGKLAYRRIKDSVLFLEKGPKGLLTSTDLSSGTNEADRPIGAKTKGSQKLSVGDLLTGGDKAEQADQPVDTTSLFVRNLNFDTSTSALAEAFEGVDGFVSARVKTKVDPKKAGQTLSMGFGFVEFKTKEQAGEAIKVMDGHVLDGHTLTVKASHRGLDAAEERRRSDKQRSQAGQRTKLIVKNLPFQASKKDIRALFGTYGQLRSVRVPKKADHTARGFAFADFVTPREAENALEALRDTHLLGRKLVLDFAEAEAADAEEEIDKMQRKVGGQMNKMALQQLTGKGRTRVTIGENEEDEGL
ncbi:Multiple RNA-binding domain-containing protein-like protein [Emericellopsis cladophorae]|uniref:Multiple RNA-binding domain-containing protein 1 n=1 Tax=Emericellopsis cladophorae TaxID=2686198 RepID=A0A9Q0BF93_9HYPO|nr:Multiple RNA-binding domain-containing protein-like protein [Emericellopsis cladophorae]KAI6783247.1 Multiple RNA-binding domain-containing protein-like protein [Emericellopsis cladophorae]